MSLGIILLIAFAVLAVGVYPRWTHSSGWGYAPSGTFGFFLVVVVILLLTGRI